MQRDVPPLRLIVWLLPLVSLSCGLVIVVGVAKGVYSVVLIPGGAFVMSVYLWVKLLQLHLKNRTEERAGRRPIA